MKYEVQIKGTTPLLPHKFCGIEESKTIKELPDSEQAERVAYRDKDEKLCIPVTNMRACIVEAFYDTAGKGAKTKTLKNIAPRIRIASAGNDPSNLTLSTQEYEIDKRSYSAGGRSGGIRDFVVRPIIPEWETEFILSSTVDISDDDLKYKLSFAGSDVGVCSNRINGYGRFEVTSFNRKK